MVCTTIKNAINGIKLCLPFSPGLKFQAVYFKNDPASGDSVPQSPWFGPQLHLLDPPLALSTTLILANWTEAN